MLCMERSSDRCTETLLLSRATWKKVCDLLTVATGYDHVVIHLSPRVSDLARSAIIAADIVVIPIQPSPYDIWAADEVVKLI